MRSGVIASLAASVLFGVLFFLPPLVTPLDENSIFAWRTFITLPLVVAALLLARRGPELRQMLQRVRRRPVLALVLICNGLLLGVQLWIFGWAPVSGHGLDVALGYPGTRSPRRSARSTGVGRGIPSRSKEPLLLRPRGRSRSGSLDGQGRKTARTHPSVFSLNIA